VEFKILKFGILCEYLDWQSSYVMVYDNDLEYGCSRKWKSMETQRT
jgi:hypothetical protein